MAIHDARMLVLVNYCMHNHHLRMIDYVPIFITHNYSLFYFILMLRHECFADIKVTVVCMIRW